MNASAISLCLGVLLTGCTLFTSEKEVRLDVDSYAGELESVLEGVWGLKWTALSGDSGSLMLDWSGGVPPGISFSVPLEEDLLILLYPPALTATCRPCPQGAYIPRYSFDGALSRKDGAALSVLTRLTELGYSMEEFNCSRFLREMAELDDPWLTDRELLVRQLGRQQMRSWYIREKKQFDVSPALSGGPWFGSSLKRVQLFSEAEGTEQTLKLPEGWGFLYNPLSREILEYQVDDHGEICSITELLLPEASSR